MALAVEGAAEPIGRSRSIKLCQTGVDIFQQNDLLSIIVVFFKTIHKIHQVAGGAELIDPICRIGIPCIARGLNGLKKFENWVTAFLKAPDRIIPACIQVILGL